MPETCRTPNGSRDVIVELRSVRWELSAQVRSTVERAGCGRTCRGRRAG